MFWVFKELVTKPWNSLSVLFSVFNSSKNFLAPSGSVTLLSVPMRIETGQTILSACSEPILCSSSYFQAGVRIFYHNDESDTYFSTADLLRDKRFGLHHCSQSTMALILEKMLIIAFCLISFLYSMQVRRQPNCLPSRALILEYLMAISPIQGCDQTR